MRKRYSASIITVSILALTLLCLAESASAGIWNYSRSENTTRMWAVGDAAPGPASLPVSDLIASRPFDYFLYLGDVYNEGTFEEYQRNYDPNFGRFASKTFPTMGNHEFPNRLTGSDLYWQSKRGSRPPRYYSFQASGWQVIVLNSELPIDSSSPQYMWLDNLLNTTPAQGNCRIAVDHRPRYSGGAHGDNRDLEPIYSRLGGSAKIFLSGHDHNMQRFAPNRGITQFISGAGGRENYPIEMPSEGRLAWSYSNSKEPISGSLRIILKKNRNLSTADLSFVSNSKTLDATRIGCRRIQKRIVHKVRPSLVSLKTLASFVQSIF